MGILDGDEREPLTNGLRAYLAKAFGGSVEALPAAFKVERFNRFANRAPLVAPPGAKAVKAQAMGCIISGERGNAGEDKTTEKIETDRL